MFNSGILAYQAIMLVLIILIVCIGVVFRVFFSNKDK